MDSLPIREKGVINWLLLYQKYHNTWANRCSSTFTVTILNYLSVRFLQQLLLGNFKFRIYPQMFAKTTFILKDGWTSAWVSRRHIAASQHAACSIDPQQSPIHARVLILNLEINTSMCTRGRWRVMQRSCSSHASVQARTHAAAVRHRPRDLVSTLFMMGFHRTAFVSQRAWRFPERKCPRNCDQQGLCKSGNSPWSRNRA